MSEKLSAIFLPPELADTRSQGEMLEGSLLGGKTERLRQLYFQQQNQPENKGAADRELVSLVIDHAKRVVAHPSRPIHHQVASFVDYPFQDLDLEETLEENPLLDDVRDLRVQLQREKPFYCVAILDASSSMSGEKHLLASIAVAVLLLEVPAENSSLIVFASEATRIKDLLVKESPQQTILKFLKSRPKGFTNIARGLEEGLSQLNRLGGQRRRVGLIATDGRTTEGKDPMEMAKLYDFLVVLHLHGPGSHIDASREMAEKGHGVCLEVEKFEELPRRLYDAIRLLARL